MVNGGGEGRMVEYIIAVVLSGALVGAFIALAIFIYLQVIDWGR